MVPDVSAAFLREAVMDDDLDDFDCGIAGEYEYSP